MAEQIVTNASGGTTSGTLGWAINQASDGDTIIFNLGTNNTVSVTTSGGLNINQSIDIDGSNTSGPEVIITGKRSRQLFSVNSGNTVQFSGMTMTAANAKLKQGGGAIDNKGTVAVSDVLFTGNTYSYCTNLTNGRGAGGLYNIGTATLENVTFSGNTGKVSIASNLASGGILNSSGTVTLKNVTFTNNKAIANNSLVKGAAIRNVTGTVHVAGTVDLATASDTWVNEGTSLTKMATVDWDLTGGTASYGTIKHFERYSNSGSYVEQTITVSAEQELGEYVIASGSLGSLAENVDDFTITGVSGQEDAAITVGGDSVTYNGLSYTLANVNNEQLVLTVASAGPSYDARIVVSGGTTVALTEGKTYTAAPYAGFGGAVYVDTDGTVTGSNVTFTGNTANCSGGAIENKGTISFTSATFTGNTAHEYGSAISNDCGTINFTDTVVFDQNVSGYGYGGTISNDCGTINFTDTVVFNQNVSDFGGAIENGGTINFTGSTVAFIGNTAYGEWGDAGAVYNYGTINFGTANVSFSGNVAGDGVSGAIENCDGIINFAGTIDLATESDLWLNEVDEGGTTVNWIISDGTTATITNFERYSNDSADVKQTITVSATQALGDYVIATGDLSDMTNKDTFYLTLDGTTLSDAIAVNTQDYSYNGRCYSLTRTDSALTLTVTASGSAAPQALGGDDASIFGGTYSRMVLGGELQSGDQEYTGSYTLDVTGGTFASDFAGGDAANGLVTRTGSVTLNVSGGIFSKAVYGGNYYAGNNQSATVLDGNVNFNISGGTFTERVYGGCGAMTDGLGVASGLFGNVNLTIDAKSQTIYFGECIAAGNRGAGQIMGNVTVTVTGLGSRLNFAEDSVLFGGCSGDYYKVSPEGVRSTVSNVLGGTRALVFDNFEGPFNAEIRMFSEISFVNNTSLDCADAALDLTEVDVWNFDCESCVTSLVNNDFKGDTINIDTSDYDGEWTLVCGAETAFTNFGEASSVTLGGVAAEWNGSAWCTAEYQLYVEEEEQLKISELA